MTLPDINVWLALAVSGHTHHQTARSWFESQTKPKSIHFCRTTQLGLLKLLTTKSVIAPYNLPPLRNIEAFQVLDAFLEDECVAFASEPKDVMATWRMFSEQRTASPKLWMDAWLAAFATCADFQLVTLDKGFSQFSGLNFLLLEST